MAPDTKNPGRQNPPTSMRGKVQDYLQDAAMDALLRNTIIYNVAWEDPRIDCQVDQHLLNLGAVSVNERIQQIKAEIDGHLLGKSKPQ